MNLIDNPDAKEILMDTEADTKATGLVAFYSQDLADEAGALAVMAAQLGYKQVAVSVTKESLIRVSATKPRHKSRRKEKIRVGIYKVG